MQEFVKNLQSIESVVEEEKYVDMSKMRKGIQKNESGALLWKSAWNSVGISLSFSACKKHISFYAGEEAIEKFASELNGFVTKKNAIYFPYSKALPIKLITDIAKWRLG